MSAKLCVALCHYPVFDRARNKVATNVTNFDIHDIARASRTYGVDHYYIVHPTDEQLMFVSRVLDHWRVGPGQKYNPMRKTALTMVETVKSLDEALMHMDSEEVQVLATHAQDVSSIPQWTWREAREKCSEKDTLLVFGTGNGLTPELFAKCTACIEPIKGYGPEDYRHLSVRSAVSIILDRLRGAW
jgi:hypothetical protein